MVPQHRRTRTRRLTVVAAAVALSSTLASGASFAGMPPFPDPSAPTPALPAPMAQMPPAVTEPAAPQAPQEAALTPAPQEAALPPASQEAAFPPAAQQPVLTPATGSPPLIEPPQPAPATPSVDGQTTGVPAQESPAFGAFLDSGTPGVARMSQLSRWLGGAELRVGHSYLPGDRWSNIEGAPGFLEGWARWRRAKDDRMFVLNVPMLERNEEGVSDGEVGWLLREGANGRFDQHFRALGERLVALGVPDTVLVLGWEMNGTTYTHRCGPDPEAWKAYWNNIVNAMRSVPGQEFRFDFTPSRGRDAIPWTECYPGDDTVDIIGMDTYDQPRGISFDEQVTEPYGLQAHVDFAQSHNKPISYPEWGLFRNGDNAEYMRRMLAWMDEHKPLYNTLTDYCPHGVWQCPANPGSSQVYQSVLFGRTGDPATLPAPTAPPTSLRPLGCSPLRLGDWAEFWLRRKACLPLDSWSRTR
ncbi:glycosyl hydrolase [Streptomyces sp. NPDC005263]|uniref:glycoside hydrolase family 26 protein n=1 Tax=Streptomyces sp. NPDC005263 TaxID=3364711 RepID=UPI0036CB9100